MTESTAAGVHDILLARSQTLAVAESLTGGLLAATIVDVPGVSATFRGGVVVYATDLKATLAGVDPALLERYGPVSAEVAAALAQGVRRRCAATWGISTTGVAGPTPQDGEPPGRVFVGVAGPDGVDTRELVLSRTRHDVRAATVAAALEALHARLAAAGA
ncbi:MAG TPA: CinA family protein [Cryptosporangiaceae bacterium]|nr:CinA family protein [Cryptosporangiaceae bacterium]